MPHDAWDLLDSLGDTPEAVAESLEKRKIKGIQGSSRHCPLACLLQQNPLWQDIVILGNGFSYRHKGEEKTKFRALPAACMTFVEFFDDWKYPALVRNYSHAS